MLPTMFDSIFLIVLLMFWIEGEKWEEDRNKHYLDCLIITAIPLVVVGKKHLVMDGLAKYCDTFDSLFILKYFNWAQREQLNSI